MTFELFQFVMNNKRALLYDNATMGGNDNSTDPTASSVNPNAFLVPDIGVNRIRNYLIIAILVLGIIYLYKKVF